MKKLLLLSSAFCCVLFFSCSSSDDSNSSSNNINSDDYLYFISGKINGEPFVYGQLREATTVDYYLSNFGNSITTDCAYYPDTGGLNYATGVYPDFENEARPSFYFDFVRFYLCGSEDSAAEMFNDAFPVSYYDFATSNDDVSGSTGDISAHFRFDATSFYFYSTLDGDQSGSVFEITSSTNETVVFGSQTLSISQLLEGNFSFKLYNTEDPSDIVEVTEGQFKLPMDFD